MPQWITNETKENEIVQLLKVCEGSKAVKLEDIARVLQEKGLNEVLLKNKFSNLTYYHYFKEGNIYMFQNESAHETFRVEIEIATLENAVIYNGLENKIEKSTVTKAE